MSGTWFLRASDAATETGPWSSDDIERMRADGELHSDVQVRRPESEIWSAIADSELALPMPTVLTDAPAPTEVPGIPELAVRDDGWQVTTPAPWRRYFGRTFDLVVIGALVWVSIGLLLGLFAPGTYDVAFAEGSPLNNVFVSTVLTCLVMVPVQALLIGTTGTSPGKWIFGTRITKANGRSIGVIAAFVREIDILVRGIGFGIPLVSLGTLLWSRSKLDDDGVTSWDRNKPWIVTHRYHGGLQIVLFVVGIAIWVATRVWLQILSTG